MLYLGNYSILLFTWRDVKHLPDLDQVDSCKSDLKSAMYFTSHTIPSRR